MIWIALVILCVCAIYPVLQAVVPRGDSGEETHQPNSMNYIGRHGFNEVWTCLNQDTGRICYQSLGAGSRGLLSITP